MEVAAEAHFEATIDVGSGTQFRLSSLVSLVAPAMEATTLWVAEKCLIEKKEGFMYSKSVSLLGGQDP